MADEHEPGVVAVGDAVALTVDHARRSLPAGSEPVLDAAAVFAVLRPWSPVGGACLKRSYQLLGYLRRLGLDADFIVPIGLDFGMKITGYFKYTF